MDLITLIQNQDGMKDLFQTIKKDISEERRIQKVKRFWKLLFADMMKAILR